MYTGYSVRPGQGAMRTDGQTDTYLPTYLPTYLHIYGAYSTLITWCSPPSAATAAVRLQMARGSRWGGNRPALSEENSLGLPGLAGRGPVIIDSTCTRYLTARPVQSDSTMYVCIMYYVGCLQVRTYYCLYIHRFMRTYIRACTPVLQTTATSRRRK